MQNLITTDLLFHYTELVNTAFSNPLDLPAKMCEYLTSKLDFQAVVFFNVDSENNFIVQGKAGSAKESYTKNSTFQCSTCRAIRNTNSFITFNNLAECEIQASDNVIYEGCLFLNIKDKGRALIKIAKQTPFSVKL
jgi:hypothetical protein